MSYQKSQEQQYYLDSIKNQGKIQDKPIQYTNFTSPTNSKVPSKVEYNYQTYDSSSNTTNYVPSTQITYKPYQPYQPVDVKKIETVPYTPQYKQPATTVEYKKYEPQSVEYKKYEPVKTTVEYKQEPLKVQPKVETKVEPVLPPQPQLQSKLSRKFEEKAANKKAKKEQAALYKQNHGWEANDHGIIEQSHIYGETKFEKVIEQCELKQQLFTDNDYRPTARNLGGDFEDAAWERDTKFYKNPKVFQGGISPTDINQGELGDCYLLASIAALSEWPDLIKSVIFVEKINKWGVYAARICWKGVWIEVIIDNFFPVKDDPPEPCFSHSTFDETWVLVLEKTWAKLHGNYCKIDGGLAREPLHDLTGAPAKTYKPDVGKAVDTEKNLFIWRRIKDGEKKNHAMCAGSIFYDEDTEEADEMENVRGLITGHIYSLISAVNLKINGQKKKVVKLRNPWGDHEWQGTLNDNDPIWKSFQAKTLEKIGYNKTVADGIFFMFYEDFLANFDDVTICYQYPKQNYRYDGLPFNISQNKEHFFKLTIDKNGIFFFQVCQRSIRTATIKLQEKLNNKFYSVCWFAIARADNGQVIQKFYGNRREICLWSYIEKPTDFEAGDYYAYVKVDPSEYQGDDPVYGFGVYGASEVNPVEIQESQCQQFAKNVRNIKSNEYEQVL